MTRFKKCDECGNIITKLGVDGVKHKGLNTEIGKGHRVLGRDRGGRIIKERPIIFYLCMSCDNFFDSMRDKNEDKFFGSTDPKRLVPKEILRLADKKSNNIV